MAYSAHPTPPASSAPSTSSGNQARPVHSIAKHSMRWVRLVIQLVFLVLAPQAFSAAFAGARSIVASVVGGLPVDVAGFVAVLALLCVYTIVFGRFFCGFACAFGTLGDVLYQFATFILKMFGKKRRMLNPALEEKLRFGKYVVLVALLFLTAVGASSIITAVGPWTAFGRLVAFQPAQMGIVATIVLVLLCILMMVKERSFCEFLCPLGAIFALLPQLPSALMRRDVDLPARMTVASDTKTVNSAVRSCTNCGTCQRACPVAIFPPATGSHMGECIQCDRCSAVCPEHCVTVGTKTPQASRRIMRAIVLSVLLLALLWACGSTSYLPTFQDTFFPEAIEEQAEETEQG